MLKKYCSKEEIERCKAEHQAFDSQGIIFDNKVRIRTSNYISLHFGYCISTVKGKGITNK